MERKAQNDMERKAQNDMGRRAQNDKRRRFGVIMTGGSAKQPWR